MINGYQIKATITAIRKLQWLTLEEMWNGARGPSEAAIVIAGAVAGMRPDNSPRQEISLADLAILLEPLLQEGLILFNATKVLEYGGPYTSNGDTIIRTGDDLPV